jgi:uncharacterized protein
MSEGTPEKVVFDRTVFAQALISPRGPAGACFSFAQSGALTLFISEYVLQEIRELPSKIRPKFGITAAKTERFIDDLTKYARIIEQVPVAYSNPFDPDDSHYIDLAVATGSNLIVSRDPHFLKLMEAAHQEAIDFRIRFPLLEITTPDVLAKRIRAMIKP